MTVFHYGGYCAFFEAKKETNFFAKIFDMIVHIIIQWHKMELYTTCACDVTQG